MKTLNETIKSLEINPDYPNGADENYFNMNAELVREFKTSDADVYEFCDDESCDSIYLINRNEDSLIMSRENFESWEIENARPDMTSQEIIEWGNERNTSQEIARAIFRLIGNRHDYDLSGERDPQKIWEAPYDDEKDIIKDAWSLADDGDDELYWGENTITRNVQDDTYTINQDRDIDDAKQAILTAIAENCTIPANDKGNGCAGPFHLREVTEEMLVDAYIGIFDKDSFEDAIEGLCDASGEWTQLTVTNEDGYIMMYYIWTEED
jgi:hypothetical protein